METTRDAAVVINDRGVIQAFTPAAGRLLDAVRALEIATDDGALPTFTMSIGVASIPPETKDLTTAIRRADQALAWYKANGRDRYEIAD